MTREALQHGAMNLAQGFPDFPAPEAIKQAAIRAIEADVNQYAITWGARDFRQALARKTRWYLGLEIDPEREVTVTCGSTEGMIATLMATVDPGDEVIVFEPFYENYGRTRSSPVRAPCTCRCTRPTGASTRTSCAPPSERTRAIILCNPTTRWGRSSRARRWRRSPTSASSTTCSASPTRSTSTSSTTRRRHPGGHVCMAQLDGDAGAHGGGQLDVQDLLGDRVAGGVLHRAAGPHRRHPQGARLPHRRRAAPLQAAGAFASRCRRSTTRRCARSTRPGSTSSSPRWSGPASASRAPRARTT
jgi:hypothetical protein